MSSCSSNSLASILLPDRQVATYSTAEMPAKSLQLDKQTKSDATPLRPQGPR